MSEFKLYVVRNAEGMFFRAKGYGGSGESWVDSLDRAKIYGRIGPARGVVTWYANNVKDYPVPTLVEIPINTEQFVVLDESQRIAKSQERKRTEKGRRDLYDKKSELERATRAYEQSKQLYEKLKELS